MSGIVGIFHLDGHTVDRNVLHAMNSRLAHRGPDDAAIWNTHSIGFGHRMLWTTQESLNEHLPLTSDDGEYTITADARIDNRDELIAALNVTEAREEAPDSALILEAYERWGESCIDHLVGDFAFAIWDSEENKLFCARDHMGVKPFYYYKSDRLFAFASEIKALFAIPEIPRVLNEVKIGDHLTLFFEDRETTFYVNVFRLPAAHVLTVGDGSKGLHLGTYWSLDPTRELFNSDAGYVSQFLTLFSEAVRCRLRSVHPVGSLLSGGLDSSSVVSVAHHILQEKKVSANRYDEPALHSFSAVFDDLPACDERSYIDAVTDKKGIKPHYLNADHLSPLVDLAEIFWHFDEPFFAPNLHIYWALCKEASKLGVRIVLDGIDGDTTLSHGKGCLTELIRKGQLYTFLCEVKKLRVRSNRSLRTTLINEVLVPFSPELLKDVWKILHGNGDSIVNNIVTAEFASRIELSNRNRSADSESPKKLSIARDMHCQRLTSGLIQSALETIDHAAAAHSLELRHPFFDKRVVEFCLALPPEQKLGHGYSRIILRRALTSILPTLVQWRGDKTRLGPCFRRSLRTLERNRLETVICHNRALIEKYIDVKTLQSAYERFLVNEGSNDAILVYNACILGLWLAQENPAFALDSGG